MSQPRIIDISCMLGPWPSRLPLFLNTDKLYKEMESYRISACVAYHSMSMWNTMPGNACMKKIANSSLGRILPCYVLEPNLGSGEMPDADGLLKLLKTEKPSAVRLYPKSKCFSLDPFYCGELLEVLNAVGIPVLLERDEVTFETLPETAKAFPNVKFVILRHGFTDSRYIIPLLKKLNNVYFDTSVMVDTGLIEEIVLKYGSERLIFGSGMPFYSPAGGLSLLLYARIGDQEKENILSANWQRIGGVKS